MRDYPVEKIMLQKAKELIERRYSTGWGGDAVMPMVKGHYFMSIAIENANAAGSFLFMIRNIVNGIIR